MQNPSPSLGEDLLRGADEISHFTGLPVRSVYYLAERNVIPVFRLGSIIAARKSELLEALSAKQAR